METSYSQYTEALVKSFVLGAPIGERVRIHREIVEGMNDLYARKNHDYGNSFAELRQRRNDSVLVRLYDKYLRVETLMTCEAKVDDERVEDTLFDLANYAVMELVERRLEKIAREEADKIAAKGLKPHTYSSNAELSDGGDSV